MKLKPPAIFKPLYTESARYYFLYGGRGSAKSWAVADYLIFLSIQNQNLNIVCLREIQRSIKHSSKRLIEDRIEHYGLHNYFDITDQEIKCRKGTGIFIFNGLQTHTVDSIKSLEGFDIAWVEESQTISTHSLELLTPTIRAENSKLIFTYNPRLPDDPIEKLKANNDDKIEIFSNYIDNPYCPTPIKIEAEQMRKKDYENYLHIFMGQHQTRSDAQIFAGYYRVEPFEIDESFGPPLHGLDFGFANDPTAIVRIYIKQNVLYINREAGKTKLELDDTVNFAKSKIPNIEKYPLPCDSARPESISHLNRHGLPKAYGVKKWPGSVEDGLEFMKMFDDIVIHPRCEQTAYEFKRYSYKVDKRTDEVLPDIEDKYNHYIDAIRYALNKMIRPRDFGKVQTNTVTYI